MKRVPKIQTIFAIILIVTSSVNSNELKLQQLNILFRHGDRTPEVFPGRFPNDPNMRSDFQPTGSGGLTNEGKLRAYHLGEVLRARYGEFLGTDYEEDRLFAISSSLSRTRMSLMLVLAALYPPAISSRQQWHESLNWQPIPVAYREFQRDEFFNRDKCEAFVEEYRKAYNSTEIQSQLKSFETFFEKLKEDTGKKSAITLDDVLLLHNNLDIENRLNLTIEPWMNNLLSDERLKEVRRFYYRTYSFNPKLRRLNAGYLLRRINEDMHDASNKKPGYEQKVSLYSGHDKNIITLLQSLNLYDSHFPEFGSALIFELWSQNERYFVKIVYYLGIPEATKELAIPGCETLCPLEKFLNLTKPSVPSDEESKCVIRTAHYFSSED